MLTDALKQRREVFFKSKVFLLNFGFITIKINKQVQKIQKKYLRKADKCLNISCLFIYQHLNLNFLEIKFENFF